MHEVTLPERWSSACFSCTASLHEAVACVSEDFFGFMVIIQVSCTDKRMFDGNSD